MRYLPDDNLSYPVLLELGDVSGSGFYFRTNEKIYVVTALHVLYKKKGKEIELRDRMLSLTSYDKDLKKTEPIEYRVDLSKVNIRKNDQKDIVLVEIANALEIDHKMTFFEGVSKVSKQIANIVVVPTKHLKKFNDVLISNEIIILGYPNSLGFPEYQQIDPKTPLLRKGIIAGKNIKNGTIILDCPVYFGNSGGIVIEIEKFDKYTRYNVIGVVSQYIPFVEQLESKQLNYTNHNIENSGYSVAVPIDTMIDLTIEPPEVAITNQSEFNK